MAEPDSGLSDLSKEEIQKLAQQMIGSITKVRIIFMNDNNTEIWEAEMPIRPGENLSMTAPSPENVQVQ